MKYEYWIFKPNSTKEVAVIIPAFSPIAHMQVGHLLCIAYRKNKNRKDLDLAIERIETTLIVAPDPYTAPEIAGDPVAQKMEVRIYTKKWK